MVGFVEGERSVGKVLSKQAFFTLHLSGLIAKSDGAAKGFFGEILYEHSCQKYLSVPRNQGLVSFCRLSSTEYF